MAMALPSLFEDIANLAAYPGVNTVILGHVEGKVATYMLPITNDLAVSGQFGYWLIRVEQYLVNPLPDEEVIIRQEEMFYRSDGTLLPPRWPIAMAKGERAVFFLSREPRPSGLPREEKVFTLVVGGPGAEGKRPIRDGEVLVIRNGYSLWEPLEEFIARIIDVAMKVGRPTAN